MTQVIQRNFCNFCNFDIFEGIQWLEFAHQKLSPSENVDFLPQGIRELNRHISQAKQIHDHFLETRGVVSKIHRCNRIPFDTKLRKKKKYKVALRENSLKRVEKDKELLPLYEEFKNVKKYTKDEPSFIGESDVRQNFEDVCVGETHR